MNSSQPNRIESELRKLRPARSPETFVNNLEQTLRQGSAESSAGEVGRIRNARATEAVVVNGSWRNWWKWLAAALGVAAIIVVVLVQSPRPDKAPFAMAENSARPVVDEVEVEQWLAAAFEGVAELPGGGPPIRFRCYRWEEDLVLRNTVGGIEVAQQGLRLELIPVGFDVY